MKKQIFVNSLIYLVAIVCGCLVNFAVSALLLKILNLFIVVDYYIGAIFCAVVSFIVVGGIVGALTYFESYKSVDFSPINITFSVLLAGVFHLPISTLLGFYPFIAGGTRYLAGLIDMGGRFDSLDRVADIYIWSYLIAFVIYLAFYVVTALACGYLGKKKRLAVRNSLEGYVDRE